MRTLCLACLSVALIVSCPAPDDEPAPEAQEEQERVQYALAIHGGAGVIPKSMPQERRQGYHDALERALSRGRDLLDQGETSLDVVEEVVRLLEDDPHFNAGKGAVFTHDGRHELDAAIMDGKTLACGAVAGLTTVRNPISLARLVMERSRHVFFVTQGAERFADEMGVERVKPEYFSVEHRYESWQEALEKERLEGASPVPETGEGSTGTVGAVALDRHGNLAAATSSGGLTNKRFGRVGDVPIVGAGTYANDKTCAVSCTGKGEEFIRNAVAHDVSALMEYAGVSLEEAVRRVIHGKLKAGDGGLIAVAHDGSIALAFNGEGMFRGAADSNGRFEVKIWE